MYRGPIIRENAYSYMYLCMVSSKGSISSMNMGTQHAQRVVVKRNICTEDTKDLCLCRSRVNGEVDMARMMVQASLIFLTDFLSLRCIFVILFFSVTAKKKTQRVGTSNHVQWPVQTCTTVSVNVCLDQDPNPHSSCGAVVNWLVMLVQALAHMDALNPLSLRGWEPADFRV